MGSCCQKLESIDHVNTLEDLKYVVDNDIELFIKQTRILLDDKSLNNEFKEKKVEYFNYLISNLKILEKELNELMEFDDEIATSFKIKYRNLMYTVYSQDQVKLEKIFKEIYAYLEGLPKLDSKFKRDSKVTPKPKELKLDLDK